MATTTAPHSKTVLILHRYFVKSTRSLVYHVRNGNNVEYYVTLNVNGTHGCVTVDGAPCPSTKGRNTCYHVKQCQAAEAHRTTTQLEVKEAQRAGASATPSGEAQLEAWYIRCHVPQGPLSHERNQDRFLGVAAIIDLYGIDVATARRIARLRQHKAKHPGNLENEREIVRDYFRLLQADTERAAAAADDPWVGLSADERRVAYAEYFMVNSY